MKFKIVLLFLLFTFTLSAQQSGFRAPSVPLVTHDPYFSIWSPADRLYDKETVHWTGANHPLHCLVRVDGKTYRVMGQYPSNLIPLKQQNIVIYPTRTIYSFGNDLIKLEMIFTSPLLVSDLDLLSRPITYITWEVKSADGKEHDVQLYFDCSGETAVNNAEQEIVWSVPNITGQNALRIGSKSQEILGKSGDNLRIDWGWAYLSSIREQNAVTSIAPKDEMQKEFINSGKAAKLIDTKGPRRVSDGYFAMGTSMDLGRVGAKPVKRWMMLGYDDLYSIRYFDSDLRPWWRRNGMDMEQLLVKAAGEYETVISKCEKFDSEIMKDLTNAGGDKYAQMCALVYRQCLAAHKLAADEKGMPLLYSKENFSNGCIATVDVIYPASPFFLLFSPELTKAMLQPLLDYSASPRWKFPFAPHDIGTYPYATGQVYGGGEETEENQMPVEETGNMLIMIAALAKAEGNADYAKALLPVLEKWAAYLLSKGFDPENQLCTDDFAGHLAHNINLSAKAIVAIGSYSVICEMLGMKEKASFYRKKSEEMVKEWIKQAGEGDHTKLAFDRPGTWSQKYNIIWDKVLGLNLFPREVIEKELKYYKKMQGEFGLPLDSRERYTKNDWITWTASLADKINDFKTIFDPVYSYANATPNRVPLSDWYIVDNAFQVGFQARSVVGGFFMKMLTDKSIWNKWFGRGTNVKGNWAPLNFPVFGKILLPTAKEKKIEWKYCNEQPSDNWMKNQFDDANWKKGEAGFGPKGYFQSATEWNAYPDIWLRNSFEVDTPSEEGLALIINYNDDAEIYINGNLVGSYSGACSNLKVIKLNKKVNELLVPGKNTIAIHCKWTGGNRYIDAGLKEYKIK